MVRAKGFQWVWFFKGFDTAIVLLHSNDRNTLHTHTLVIFILYIYIFIYLSIYLFIYLCVYVFVYLFIYSFI